MSWNVTSVMQSRREFANLASQPQADICQICHRFDISRKTAYKWLQRYRAGTPDWAADRSRRPHHSPNQTPQDCEARVVSVRNGHPAWGGRKIRQVLINQGQAKAPAPSTVTSILHRYHKIDPEESAKRQAYVRFERETPNELWQMDFKGDFAMMNGRCHTLAVLDDHSRYALCLAACADQREATRARMADANLSPLWPATMHADGQRIVLGHDRAGTPHASDRVADPAGREHQPWPPVPSSNAGQTGAVQSHFSSRGRGPLYYPEFDGWPETL
jgi:transposase-like protein